MDLKKIKQSYSSRSHNVILYVRDGVIKDSNSQEFLVGDKIELSDFIKFGKKNYKVNKTKIGDYFEVTLVDLSKSIEDRNLRDLISELEKKSYYDTLVDIPNKRYFLKEIERNHSTYLRNNKKYSVLFLDIDHFKNYNDTNGHEEGDYCLKEVGEIIKKSLRAKDFPARYGGEEFVVICPNTDLVTAKKIGERIRKNICEATLRHSEKQPLGTVSVSIGVAEIKKDEDHKALLKRADSSLYKSKENGRNRVS